MSWPLRTGASSAPHSRSTATPGTPSTPTAQPSSCDSRGRPGKAEPMAKERASPAPSKARLRELLAELMLTPGLSGHEGRVRRRLNEELVPLGIPTETDRLGNLIASMEGDPDAPNVMLFAHMDQLGLVVRKIEADGLIRVERLGGVPEKALPSQEVLLCVRGGDDVSGVIANKSHHATAQDEKYRVLPYADLFIDV